MYSIPSVPPRRVTPEQRNLLGNQLVQGKKDEQEAMNYYDVLLSNVRGMAGRFPDSAATLRRMETEIMRIRNQEFQHWNQLNQWLISLSSL